MARDISGVGSELRIIASVTFPVGIEITEFADDADPFDFGSQTVAETALSLNGDLVSWSTANPIPFSLNVIPGSEDDQNLATLLEANRVGLGKSSARDSITVVYTHPSEDIRSVILTNGRIIDGMNANSVASGGRFKSKPYSFAFENKAEA